MYNRRNGDGNLSQRGKLRICQCECYCREELTVKKIDLCTACSFNRHVGQDGRTYRRPKDQ